MWDKISKLKHTASREQGFSLVEILVAMAVFAVIAAVATSVIITINDSAAKFSTTSSTQNDVAAAVATINTDISSAAEIIQADEFLIHTRSYEDNVTTDTAIFYSGPGAIIPTVVSDTGKLPDYPALVEYRVVGGTVGVKVLVKNYVPEESASPLFKYFDKANSSLETPMNSTTNKGNLNKISRVEFFVSAKIADRVTPVELASSASPRTLNDPSEQSPSNPTKPEAPILQGNLPAGETTSHLNWTIPAGATSYTMYVKLPGASDFTVLQVVPNPNTNTLDHPNLTYGATYSYQIYANGPLGLSPPSNIVTLKVVPAAPTIVNINSTKALADVKTGAAGSAVVETGTTNPYGGAKYTVARTEKTNQVNWTPVSGADKYEVLRNGAIVATLDAPITTYVDSDMTKGPNFGRVTEYSVRAWNSPLPSSGGTVSGGSGSISNDVDLISPPLASAVTAAPQSTSTNATNSTNIISVATRAANTTGYKVAKKTSLAATQSCTLTETLAPTTALAFTTAAPTDTVTWGSTSCYIVTPYNDAGDGVKSLATEALPAAKSGEIRPANAQPTSIRQLPAEFNLSNSQTQARKKLSYVGAAEDAPGGVPYGDWQSANGSTTNVTTSFGSRYGMSTYTITPSQAGVNMFSSPGVVTIAGSNTNYTYVNMSPASNYNFWVKGIAANGRGWDKGNGGAVVTSADIPGQWMESIQRANLNYRWAIFLEAGPKYGYVTGVAGNSTSDEYGSQGWNYAMGGIASGAGRPGCAAYCWTTWSTGQVYSYANGIWGVNVNSPTVSWRSFISWFASGNDPCSDWCAVSDDSAYRWTSNTN